MPNSIEPCPVPQCELRKEQADLVCKPHAAKLDAVIARELTFARQDVATAEQRLAHVQSWNNSDEIKRYTERRDYAAAVLKTVTAHAIKSLAE